MLIECKRFQSPLIFAQGWKNWKVTMFNALYPFPPSIREGLVVNNSGPVCILNWTITGSRNHGSQISPAHWCQAPHGIVKLLLSHCMHPIEMSTILFTCPPYSSKWAWSRKTNAYLPPYRIYLVLSSKTISPGRGVLLLICWVKIRISNQLASLSNSHNSR